MGNTSKDVPWDAVAYLKASRRRKQVFKHIASEPQMATEIADKMGVSRRTVSKYISHLKEDPNPGGSHDLVECYTPDRRNHRIYGLTETGEIVADHV